MEELMVKSTDFGAFIRRKIESDPKLKAGVEREDEKAQIARAIFNARTGARMTQAELAKAVGTHQGVISRLENANYKGHSLRLLRRIAKATGNRLSVEFYPVSKSAGISQSSLLQNAEVAWSERSGVWMQDSASLCEAGW